MDHFLLPLLQQHIQLRKFRQKAPTIGDKCHISNTGGL